MLKGRKKTRIPVIGKQFGDLTVISNEETKINNHPKWLCRCKCGAENWFFTTNLIDGGNGRCKSCCIKNTTIRCTKHGGRDSTLYTVWSNMKARCYNKKAKRIS